MAKEITTPNYEIDPNDKRLTSVNSNMSAALTDIENAYGDAVGNSDKYYNQQAEAVEKWGAQQQEIQQQQSDLAIKQIEQQKQQTEKDYIREQSGAYVDWQKQSNGYGAEAEKMAANGLSNTGYSETSQVLMYNAYQQRVAVARESFERAKVDYDNAMTEAKLQNNAARAELAYQTLMKKLELSLEGFQYKNSLLIEKANKKNDIRNTYQQQYMQMMDQIHKQNALAEEVRQYNTNLEWEKEQFNKQTELAENEFNFSKEMAQKEFDFAKQQYNDSKKTTVWGTTSGGKKTTTGKTGGAPIMKTMTDAVVAKNAQKENAKNNPIPNQASVKALGVGNLTNSQLTQLVKDGKVFMSEKNGQLYFRWNATFLKICEQFGLNKMTAPGLSSFGKK